MKPSDITIVTAVDAHHAQELQMSYKTWVKYKPEVLEMPMILIYDENYFGARPNHDDLRLFHQHPNITFAPWSASHICNQRERMLTSLVMVPATAVQTPWYVKIDTDTVATQEGPWINPEWFRKRFRKHPVLVASPWGYSKPADALERLDRWGDRVPIFDGHPSSNVERTIGEGKVHSKRIISWLMFGDTKWTQQMAAACGGCELPVPSQDTFLWYCAARRGDRVVREKMNRYGWAHYGRKFDRLKQACQELLR